MGKTSNAIARKIESIEEKGGMRSVDVANILGTRPETVSRWNQGKAFPRGDTERTLLDLEYIVDQLSDFYEPLEARVWLYSRQRLLGGECPVTLIQQGNTSAVIQVLDELRDSIFL
jgi:hypothetical protein